MLIFSSFLSFLATSSPIVLLDISLVLLFLSSDSTSSTTFSIFSAEISLFSQDLIIPLRNFPLSKISRLPSFLTTNRSSVSTRSKVVNLRVHLLHSRLLLVIFPRSPSRLSTTFVTSCAQKGQITLLLLPICSTVYLFYWLP